MLFFLIPDTLSATEWSDIYDNFSVAVTLWNWCSFWLDDRVLWNPHFNPFLTFFMNYFGKYTPLLTIAFMVIFPTLLNWSFQCSLICSYFSNFLIYHRFLYSNYFKYTVNASHFILVKPSSLFPITSSNTVMHCRLAITIWYYLHYLHTSLLISIIPRDMCSV